MENKSFKFLSILTIFVATIMQLSLIVAYKPVQIGWFIVPGWVVGFPMVFTLGDIILLMFMIKQQTLTHSALKLECYLHFHSSSETYLKNANISQKIPHNTL